MPIETFNILFESTQKKQQCGIQISFTDVRILVMVGDLQCYITFFVVVRGFDLIKAGL